MPRVVPGQINLNAVNTVQEAQRSIARRLQSAGIETADVDARYLLQGILGLQAAALLSNPTRPLGTAAALALNAAVNRRLQGEPVSRILGRRWFYGREFEITADVLDPRPDTETIVEAALEIVKEEGWNNRDIRLADIGTGSGALIVTLLAELTRATGIATDISPAALAVAKANAVRHGVVDRAEFIHTRNFGQSQKHFDLIVANPPYIPSSEIAVLAQEVRDFDPHLALDGGQDGLEIYREIASEIKNIVGPTWVLLEVGAGQADDVVALFGGPLSGSEPDRFRVTKDLGGHARCVAVRIHR